MFGLFSRRSFSHVITAGIERELEFARLLGQVTKSINSLDRYLGRIEKDLGRTRYGLAEHGWRLEQWKHEIAKVAAFCLLQSASRGGLKELAQVAARGASIATSIAQWQQGAFASHANRHALEG